MTRVGTREIQLALALAVNAGFLYAWSIALGDWIGPSGSPAALSLPSLVGLLVLAALAARLASTRLAAGRFAGLAVALLGVALALATGLIALWSGAGTRDWGVDWTAFGQTSLGLKVGAGVILAMIVWWRGIATGRTRLAHEDVEAGLRVAILALAAVFLINLLASGSDALVDSTLLGPTVAVLFAGLIGLPLARIDDLSARPRDQGAPPLGVRGHWLAMLLGTVGALILITAVLAQLLTFQRISDLTRPLAAPLDALLWAIFSVVIVPFALLVELLVDGFHLLFRPTHAAHPLQTPNVNWVQALHAQGQAAGGPPSDLLTAAKWAAGIVVVAIVVWLLARALSRFAIWRSDDDVDEARDFVWSWALVGDWLRQLIQRLRGWRPRPRTPTPRDDRTDIAAERWLLGPRELYRELLRLGARHGRAREPDETPREYDRALAEIAPFSAARSETRQVTLAYTRARYGDTPPDNAELERARRALQRLRSLDEPARPTERRDE